MKSLIFTILGVAGIGLASQAQPIHMDPSPTDVTSNAKLVIDITSSQCNCPALQDLAVPNPPEPLYIWTWNPNEQRDSPYLNGVWNNSNENMKMTQDPTNPAIWSFDFDNVPLTTFYGVSATTMYSVGIDFLVKKKDGSADASGVEQKSPDQHIDLVPLTCVDKVCPFPTKFFQDEYTIINYDTKLETNTALQNLGPDQCYIYIKYSVNGGAEQTYGNANIATLASQHPELKMEYDGDGVFSFALLPQDFLGLQEGDTLTNMTVIFSKQPFQGAVSSPTTLTPGCQ